MKPFKTFLYFLTIAGILTASQVFSQDKKAEKKNAVREAVAAQRYIFKARSAMPAKGRTIQLTSEYNLTVTKDSVIAYLPYYGRAYTAQIGKTTGGIDFTSTKFSYKVTERKKGGWDIEIKPSDADDVEKLFLTLSEQGYGTLSILSRNRQQITYTGYAEPF